MKAFLGGALLLALALYLTGCAWLYTMQRSLLYYPTPEHPFDPARATTLDVGDATLRIATHAHEGSEAVLYFGGNAEDVALTLPQLERLLPDRALFLMHYRGYGGSTGSPREKELHSDALALYESVHRAHPHISVIGRSLGSGIALRLATERPVDRLILITPYDSIANVAQTHYPYVPIGLLLKDRYESWKLAPQIKVPTTVLVAAHDDVIPRKHSNALMKAFMPGIATQHVIPETDHNTISGSAMYETLLRDAFGADGT